MTDWRNRRVLVTGASGFIGSHLAERLVAEGADVRVLVRHPDRLIDSFKDRVEVVKGDLLQPDCFVPATRDCGIVFHVAGWLGIPNRPDAAHAINVAATRQLADAARSAGVRRFIYTSSIAVYGPVLDGRIYEAQPHWPVYTYAETKSRGESAALEAMKDQFGVTIIRPGHVYGPRGRAWTTLPVALARRGLPSLIGGGHGLCHPVYVENLVDAYLLAAGRDEAIGEAFTICDGDVEWREFFGRYAAMVGKRARSVPVALVRGGAALAEWAARIMRRPSNVNRSMIGYIIGRCHFTIEKANRLLGWSPRVSFGEAMRRTEMWLGAAGYLQ